MSNLRGFKERKADKLRAKTHRFEKRGEEHKRVEVCVVEADWQFERKGIDSEGGIQVEGYGSIFNTKDSYRDIILPGSFKKYNKEKWPYFDKKSQKYKTGIKFLWQHNPDWPFGKPIHLEEDSVGLADVINFRDNATNNERLDYMEDGIVTGQSIGFVTLDADFDEEDEDDYWPLRYIKAIDLWEISAVTFPAHSDALTELVKRNREIALAVKSADHGRVLEFATKHKGITIPAIEEAISVFKHYANVLKEADQGDLPEVDEPEIDEPDVDEPDAEPDAEPVQDDTPDPDDPIVNGDTSEEDSEFIKALEGFAFEMKADEVKRAIRSGGR